MAYDFKELDPYAMVADIPNWVLNQWRAWYEIHHMVGNTVDPEFRGDVRIAKGFAYLANHWRKNQPLSIEDMLAFKPEKPPQTPEQLQAALEARVRFNNRLADRKAAKGTPNGVDVPQPNNKTGNERRRSGQRRRASKDPVDGTSEGVGNS